MHRDGTEEEEEDYRCFCSLSGGDWEEDELDGACSVENYYRDKNGPPHNRYNILIGKKKEEFVTQEINGFKFFRQKSAIQPKIPSNQLSLCF